MTRNKNEKRNQPSTKIKKQNTTNPSVEFILTTCIYPTKEITKPEVWTWTHFHAKLITKITELLIVKLSQQKITLLCIFQVIQTT